jgi:hypothetical protein
MTIYCLEKKKIENHVPAMCFFCTLCQRVKDCELYVGVWGELDINRAYVGTGKNQTKGKGKQNMK